MSDHPDDTAIGGYAPGSYWGRCLHCGGTFRGRKLAHSCRGCAIRLSAPPATPHLDAVAGAKRKTPRRPQDVLGDPMKGVTIKCEGGGCD